MDLNLKGKTAFISGSTSGIGFTTAKTLLEEGVTVYINGRDKLSIEKAVIQLKDEVATTIAYLYSPLSSATNGSVIKVDGGSSGGIL